MLAWSRSANRARLLGIRFHSEWRHPDCTVMRWYDNQSASSRKFQTIEHRRDTHGPFYHEFLLLKLTDGAICRLERVGEGSRTDAIRYIGCTANDLVQWFDPDDYAKLESDHPSVLISEVSFPSEYDILDVLAICYSIQNTEACRVYTLQRYNCYFLCLTVLGVLTRRAASWENEITDHIWDSALARELARLSNLSGREVKEILMLRVLTMLEPNNPHSSEPLLEELRLKLQLGREITRDIRKAVRSALWMFPWESETQIETIASRAVPLVTAEKLCLTRLRSILMNSVENSGQSSASNEAVVEFYDKELFKRTYNLIYDSGQLFPNLYQMIEIEQPISYRTWVLSQLIRGTTMLLAAIWPRIMSELDPKDREDCQKFIGAETSNFTLFDRLNLVKVYLSPLGYASILACIGDDRYLEIMQASLNRDPWDHFASIATSVLNTLESKGMLEQEANVKLVLAHMLTSESERTLERPFVLSTLLGTLKIVLQGQSEHIRVKAWVR
ncbi:hypothetical protein FRC06_001933 [Ceratobasidium sp. 370]|nr:hypothetical protein FRC06_001933 [Ceratobasidium sp. 370]